MLTVPNSATVAEFGTVDDNFDNVNWLASIGISYNPPTNAPLCTHEVYGL